MQVCEALARALYDNDIRKVFGVLGDANLFIMNSFHEMADAEYIGAASEGGAVLSAVGYGQVSGKLAVASVTHGPGLTNTLTALVEAERARQPLLLIAGDSPLSQREHIQDIDQRMVALAAGVAFERVRSAESAVADVAAAVRRAWVERIPVVLNVPIEIQWQEVEYRAVRASIDAVPSLPATESIEDAVGLIASSARPLVLAGRGVALSGATEAIARFAERVGAPLATTLRGKDQFRGLPQNLGVFGTLSHEAALQVITHSDCVIAFGCGLNPWTTAEGSLVRGKRVVHVDTDATRLDKSTTVDVAVLGDAQSAADAMAQLLDDAEVPASKFVDTAIALVSAGADDDRPSRATTGNFDTAAILARVNAAVPKNRVVVTDNGRFIKQAFTALEVEEPQSYAHAVSFGAIGCGMSVALGATYAAPDRPVLVAVGDGGFALGGLSDLVMAVQQKRNLVVLLLNDFAYGAEYVQLTGRDMEPGFTTLTWPDFGEIAKSIGAQGYTASNFVELDEALSSLDFASGPALLEVRIDPAKA
ncbi:thiamine pyrophosphate-binding protein [Rhodococcus sp. ACS1]|uniref:thiamine pyrophosphate-binding protein n=1 Tax=Rhodococcus sp. ACS1 TaxID=2028570 RepID=UPI0015CAD9FF|nr:thiamine pyrophosphate-binding protein [Rhodococcus sp. ACS1]